VVDGLIDGQGGGLCVYDAIVGFYLIVTHLGVRDCWVQVGTLMLQLDEEDPTLFWAIDDSRPESVATGEFHAWVGTKSGVLVDFSARRWPAMVEGRMGGMQFIPLPDGSAPASRYSRPRLDYIWSAWNRMPGWVRLVPDAAATKWLGDNVIALMTKIKPVLEVADLIYMNPDATVITGAGVI
jgi:hypothetical protein